MTMTFAEAPPRLRAQRVGGSKWILVDDSLESAPYESTWETIGSDAGARTLDAQARLAYLRSQVSAEVWEPDDEDQIAEDRAIAEALQAAQLRTVTD